MKDKNKKIVLISGITVILLMIVGISFAIFRFGTESSNQQLVLGDIWMNYAESNGIFLEGALPGDPYSNYFEFTISGTNTYTKKDIYYDISLVRGEVPQEKEEENRIEDKYLMFRLTEVVGDTETEIFTDKTYFSLENKRIHVATIGKSVSNYSKTYRLYMTISNELTYGNAEGAILTTEEFGKIFGSVKVNVTGDFNEKELPKSASEEIAEKVVTYEVASASDFTGGLVAINGTEGNDYGLLYNENNDTHTIREYRYSGLDVDNYIYYNCPDTANGKNYGDLDYDYANNCEVWRIVGIFYENGEQFLKIMNNNTLTDIPTTYVIDDTTYTVGSSDGIYAYWNKPDTLKSTNYTDWTRAGFQYYLNTEEDESVPPVAGYLSTLSTNAKNLIRETIYYLGNVSTERYTMIVYTNERENKECSSEIITNSHNNDCNIWYGNEPTWTGKVGLLYPSDYGYSASNLYWETDMKGWHTAEDDGIIASSTSWMQETANHTPEWLLSPFSKGSAGVVAWGSPGNVGGVNAFDDGGSVREVLNLKSNTKVLKGDGDVNSPYVVVAE